MRGTDPTGPPECRSTEWSTDWGCSLEPNLLREVKTSSWIASRDLFKCCLAGWSTIESVVARKTHFKWLQSQGEVQPTSLLQQWFNTVRCTEPNIGCSQSSLTGSQWSKIRPVGNWNVFEPTTGESSSLKNSLNSDGNAASNVNTRHPIVRSRTELLNAWIGRFKNASFPCSNTPNCRMASRRRLYLQP